MFDIFRNINNNNNNTIKSPCSGIEPSWEPDKWKSNSKYNNCYSYALNDHNESRQQKAIPGTDSSGLFTCSRLMDGIKLDHPQTYVGTFEKPCQIGFRKIYAAVADIDDSGENDFHFWRQDQDGLWSHKPGSSQPSRLDATNGSIIDPELSDRIFENRAYVNGCGFFCI
jgi:hypothetical protein